MTDALSCGVCGAEIPPAQGRAGRPSRYCSKACRQRAYRQRTKAGAAPAPALAGITANLSSFVGRSHELVAVGQLMRASRLVTLVGTVGVGKTRLATELAAQIQRGARCEVVLVELGTIARGTVVWSALAAVLRMTGTPANDDVVAELTGRDLLLVLDNCEHVVDECGALLGELLPRLPDLRVLVTSREPLRLPGEVTYSLAGLGGGSSLAEHLRSDAVRLFIDRARAVVPELEVSDADVACVAAVCARLDGLPLAIELAARLVRVFPLGELCDLLDDQLSLLTSGWRTSDRHQNLRTAIAWSYDLLPQPEQRLFRRLSLLPNEFGPDTAVAVCAGDAISPSCVLELMAKLEAKSLIASCPAQRDTARFRMLECIRYYAREQLIAHGEQDETRERLVAWLTDMTHPMLEHISMSETLMRQLEEHHDTLTHVVERLGSGDDERQLLLATALTVSRMYHGPLGDIRQVLGHALEQTDADSRYRSLALGGAALAAGWQGDHEEAFRLSAMALDMERHTCRLPVLGRLLRARRCIAAQRGDQRAATAAVREALEICRAIGDHLGAALCLNDLARQQLHRGDLTEATQLAGEVSDALTFVSVPPINWAAFLDTRAALALVSGDLAGAETSFTDALRFHANRPSLVARAIEGLAIIALRTGRLERGIRLAAAASSAFESARIWRHPWYSRNIESAMADARRQLPASRCATLIAYGQSLDLRQAVEYALADDRGAEAGDGQAAQLSKREWEVITLVSKGLTNRQIAGRLNLSVRTVETHVRKIRDTLGLRSRAHAAAWAAQQVASG